MAGIGHMGSLLRLAVPYSGILFSRLHDPQSKREAGQSECCDCDALSLHDDPFPKTLDGDFRRFSCGDLVGVAVFAYRQYFWRGNASHYGGMESGHIGSMAQRVVLVGCRSPFSRLIPRAIIFETNIQGF